MATVNPFQEIVPESVSATAPSSSSSSTSSFDVFINHCGADVKFTLATNIRDKLSAAGLSVFLDVDSLYVGDVIPAKIEQAMRSASVHVAIFSVSYAKSPWCLAELAFMLQTGKTIIPVFYHLQPSDLRWVRAQENGIYAAAFSHYEDRRRYSPEKLEEWKAALEKASFIKGIEVKHNKDEGMVLKNIVNMVFNILPKAPFLVSRKPVGLDDTVLDFERNTADSAESAHNVQVVGIVGMGGAGKTTLAKELYNRKSSSFQSSSFVFEVRDAASRKALHEKQKKLLGDLGVQGLSLENIEEGKTILASRLRSVRALIVLDDVDHENQLDALLPGKDCLASGSLVIVTTRELHLLAKWGSTIYMMKGLEHFHAKKLFCWHAFLQSHPEEGFENTVEQFLKACNGLPLSLEVFGGLVYGRCKDYWKSQLDKISRVLPEDIRGRLKVSYDSLDEEQKEMFMDVACFFIRKNPTLAIEIWNGLGWSGLQGWETLVNKCLITVDGNNQIRMHDHLRDLGRDLAGGHSIASRVWLPEQIMNIQKQARAGRSIRGIDADSFGYMPLRRRQRLEKLFELTGTSHRCFGRPPPSPLGLKLFTDSGYQCIKYFSASLEEPVWLKLGEFKGRNLPSWSFKNLRILELRNVPRLRQLWDNSYPPLQLRDLRIDGASKLQRIPKSIGCLKELKRIVLHDCQALKNLPEEFCGLRSLEWLDLSQCIMMSSLPSRLGDLINLRHIDLSGCRRLRVLPDSCKHLRHLQHLNLSLCKMMSSLPSRLGDLINLRHIDLSRCSRLQVLPDSFKQLRHLQHLNLSYCVELTFRSDMLQSIGNLEYLNFEECRKLELLPNQITNQVFLRELHVRCTRIREIPSDIGELRKLEVLEIESPFLASLPSSLGNLSSLTRLRISSDMLTALPNSLGNLSSLTELNIYDAPSLTSLPSSFDNLSSLVKLSLFYCKKLNSLPDIVGSLTMLKVVQITLTAVSTISLSDDSCPNLKTLELEGNDHLMDIQTLPTSLGRLVVRASKMLKKIMGLRGLANLQSLHIHRCPELNELASFVDLHSLKEVRISDCGKVVRIEGIENCRSLETMAWTLWESQVMQSLEGMEKLKRLEIVAENISALQPCIQTINIGAWPEEMLICGRAVSGAKSVMDSLSLSFPTLTVLTSLKELAPNKCMNRWSVEYGETSGAVIVCWLVSSTLDDSFRFRFSREGQYRYIQLRKGKWVVVGVATKSCKVPGYKEKPCVEISYPRSTDKPSVYWWSTDTDKVERGMSVVGEEGRVLEAFTHFWPLFI